MKTASYPAEALPGTTFLWNTTLTHWLLATKGLVGMVRLTTEELKKL
jgi:hypothetical protein